MDGIRQELEGFAGQGSNFGAMVDRIKKDIPMVGNGESEFPVQEGSDVTDSPYAPGSTVTPVIAETKKRGPYPYYRLTNYVNRMEEGYKVICEMYFKYYHGRQPCAIAKSGREGKGYEISGEYLALWLMGDEAVDEKTKEIGNNEPMGEIVASWDWCPDLQKGVK